MWAVRSATFLLAGTGLSQEGMLSVSPTQQRSTVATEADQPSTLSLDSFDDVDTHYWTGLETDATHVKEGSDAEATDGLDYYYRVLDLDWTGWKHLVLPRSAFSAYRQPAGWEKVDKVVFSSDWNTRPKPDTVLYFDDIVLTRIPIRLEEVGLADVQTQGNQRTFTYRFALTNADEQPHEAVLSIQGAALPKDMRLAVAPEQISLSADSTVDLKVTVTVPTDWLRSRQALRGQTVEAVVSPAVAQEFQTIRVAFSLGRLFYEALPVPPHPRLFFSPADLPRLREKTQQPGAEALWASLQRIADRVVAAVATAGADHHAHDGQEVDPEAPNRQAEEPAPAPHLHIGVPPDALAAAALVYLVTGEAKYAEAATHVMEHLIGKESWVSPQHRPRIDDQATVLALHSGGKDAHSHLDLNSFVLSAFGEPLVVEVPGRGYYEDYFDAEKRWTHYEAATIGHNTILIDNANQLPDEDRRGRIVTFLDSPRYDYVCADARAVYPENVTQALRHVLFVRPDYFLMVDELEATSPAQFDWLAHTAGKIDVAGNRVSLIGESAALAIQFWEPSIVQVSLEQHERGEPYVRVSPPDKQQVCRFTAILQPLKRLPSAGPSPELTAFKSVSRPLPEGGLILQVDRTVVQDTLALTPARDRDQGLGLSVVNQASAGPLVGFAACHLDHLEWEGQPLLSAEVPVTAAVSYSTGAEKPLAMGVYQGPAAKLSIHCPVPPHTVLMDGASVPWKYQDKEQQVAFTVPAGRHEVTVR